MSETNPHANQHAGKPCILCVAITGSLPTKENNPAVPITIAEQVESTQQAFEAGATIAHCHVRDDEGKPTSDPERFARLITERSMASYGRDWVICTGGGPGVMEAGNLGAHEVGGKSIGLGIVLPHEQAPNAYVTPDLCFNFHYFAIRKMHFLMRARAVTVFPGGFGTMDEMFEALTLIQRAVDLRPDDGYILDSLAWAYYRMGRYAEAVAPMEKAVAAMSDDSLVNDHMGDIYWMVGRKREAEIQWHRALSLEPETEAEAHRIRAKLDRGLDAVLAEEAAGVVQTPAPAPQAANN